MVRKSWKSSGAWTLEEAQKLIAELEPQVRELDYHTLLGGGVLHDGRSENDLDIWFMPLNGYESNTGAIYDLMVRTFGVGSVRSLRDSPDYDAGEPWHIKEAWKTMYCGKRIDLFVL